MAAGRPLSELVGIYIQFQSQALSEYISVSNNVFMSKFQGLTLAEYCTARRHYCSQNHNTTCKSCNSKIQAAQMIVEGVILPMSTVSKKVFPAVTYLSVNAKRRLLQMPAVAIRIQGAKKGDSELYLMEKINGLNYEQLSEILSENAQKVVKQHGISKQELKQLLTITKTERERELIRYTVFKTSGVTPTKARRWLGFENMQSRALHVESCVQEVQELYEAVESLAKSQDEAVLDTFGIVSTSSESSGHETDCSLYDADPHSDDDTMNVCMPDNSSLAKVLHESDFNWFQFNERVERMMEHSNDCNVFKNVEEFFLQIPHFRFSQSQLELIVQSHRAFEAAKRESYEDELEARIINGEVVSESESEDPEQYVTGFGKTLRMGSTRNSRNARF